MPLYSYKCAACSAERDVMLKLDELDSVVLCKNCPAGHMVRQLSAPLVRGDSHISYDCPVTGERIEGIRAHRENLARRGCRILEPGELDQHRQRQKAGDQALERAVEQTTDRLIAGLPTEKRDRLAAEMENGLDVAIERRTYQPGT